MCDLAACRDMQHAFAVHLSTGLQATAAPAPAAALAHTIVVCLWPDWGTSSASKQMGALMSAFCVHSGCEQPPPAHTDQSSDSCLLPAVAHLGKGDPHQGSDGLIKGAGRCTWVLAVGPLRALPRRRGCIAGVSGQHGQLLVVSHCNPCPAGQESHCIRHSAQIQGCVGAVKQAPTGAAMPCPAHKIDSSGCNAHAPGPGESPPEVTNAHSQGEHVCRCDDSQRDDAAPMGPDMASQQEGALLLPMACRRWCTPHIAPHVPLRGLMVAS